MRINHNISAMITQNSGRQQGIALNKSLEKLSTGLRVNRASDDAAGLAVSEGMRSQIRGMLQAKRNSKPMQHRPAASKLKRISTARRMMNLKMAIWDSDFSKHT